MRFPLVLASIALTFCCWGAYGPVLHVGQDAFGIPGRPSGLRPFICVGLAYFLIAVVVPIVMLRLKGEKGSWTMGGTVWSIAAGLVTAIGALGIVLAFKFRGSPIYVMPLVFGCAPVVNTFVTMAMSKTFKEAGPIFYAGVIVAAVGAAGVLFFKPEATKPEITENEGADEITIVIKDLVNKTEERFGPLTKQELNSGKYPKALAVYNKAKTKTKWVNVFASIALTAICWGAYGPLLHKGQMKMGGSRMRPFLCVGLSYFLIAVLVPLALTPVFPEAGSWSSINGWIWSLGGGALGALGALGIIMAFNFGGKPVFVMPLVFGVAPLINTFITVTEEGTASNLSAMFFGSLALAIAGAVTVLIFAPKAHPPAPGGKPMEDATKEKVAAH